MVFENEKMKEIKMNIYIDNSKLDFQIEIDDTLDTIVKSVEEFAKNNGRVVVEVKVDGKDLGELENKGIATIEDIEFFTKSGRIIALEAIQEMNAYIERLKNGSKQLVDEINNGDGGKISQMTLDAIDGLEWIYNILYSIENISTINYTEIGFQKTFDKYQDIIMDILESLEDKDEMLLADLMEYEIPDIVEEIKEFLPKIYDMLLEEEKRECSNC